MTGNREIRAAARQAIGKGWFWRILLCGVLLNGIAQMACRLTDRAYVDMNIATWTGYFMAKASAHGEDLICSVPSMAVAGQMTVASAFQLFVLYIFSAIAIFGMIFVSLKAARRDAERWFAGSFGGFARPLELTWLMVLVNLKTILWSLLFVIPGVVAVYRYRLAWYLKADNGDWSAARCIAESGRMMRGCKWQAFRLDMSIFVWIFCGALVSMLALALGHAFDSFAGVAFSLIGVFGVWIMVYSIVYLQMARTIMYEEIRKP